MSAANKGPRVVAVGGGHGLACTLHAAKSYTGAITAIVSVADDGGSSGRLREQLGIPAPGDVRKCLAALAPEGSVLGAALGHRFSGWELDGHAFGNLLIAALAAETGDFLAGVAEAGRVLGIVGSVLPATLGPVDLKAEAPGGELEGQVRINATRGVQRISLVPPDPEVPTAALEAVAAADQIVIGPGSLFTSVLAACAPPALREAIAASTAQRVYVCNLHQQAAETSGYDAAAHLEAVLRHGIEPDVVLVDPAAMPLGGLAGVAGLAGPGVARRREAAAPGSGRAEPSAERVELSTPSAAEGAAALWSGRVLERPMACGTEAFVHDPGLLAGALVECLELAGAGA